MRKQATAALDAAERAGIKYSIHSYEHDNSQGSYGVEAAAKLGVEADQIFKTLVAGQGSELVIGIVPVVKQLDLKALASELNVKTLDMVDVAVAERTTGYVKGGISPLGQKKSLRTVIDVSATRFKTMYVSAGRRGMEIELAPEDLCRLTRATFAAIARD